MTQTIYIALDDSGKLSKKENITTYGGIIFLSKKELDNFIIEYKFLTEDIKNNYYNKQTNSYLELKHYHLNNIDRKKFINYLSKYYLIAGIIQNKNIYANILNNPKSKGRFLDYVVKMTIKTAIINLIKENIINPNNNLKIIINIDEQNYKSNGYYNLKESIYEELKFGMINFKTNSNFKAIIKGKLEIKLNFLDSKTSYSIQAADIVAGYTRKFYISSNKSVDVLKSKIFFP